MEAWADMRGHLPARENTGGPAVDGHLISTDPVALPVLILLFGQEYVEGDGDAPSQHYSRTLTLTIHSRPFGKRGTSPLAMKVSTQKRKASET
eukprot:COSAG03_NODE_366_length_8532_cov_32.998696_3_plen_93_part_00